MIFVSDVHGAVAGLKRLVELGDAVAILGDVANLTDYRSGEGALADVLGLDFARSAGAVRGEGDYVTMRRLWMEHVGDRFEQVRRDIAGAIDQQYDEIAGALEGGHGYVIHGNVDRPPRLRSSLPRGFRFVHGEVIEAEGARIGFAGGGVETPLRAEGEVNEEEMTRLLDTLGPVDVLCTHVPPSIPSLRKDVITGRHERGSTPVLDYLKLHQPRIHLFGDVHQAQATTWRVGRTRCYNVGYFRATGRYLSFDGAVVQVRRLGYPRS